MVVGPHTVGWFDSLTARAAFPAAVSATRASTPHILDMHMAKMSIMNELHRITESPPCWQVFHGPHWAFVPPGVRCTSPASFTWSCWKRWTAVLTGCVGGCDLVPRRAGRHLEEKHCLEDTVPRRPRFVPGCLKSLRGRILYYFRICALFLAFAASLRCGWPIDYSPHWGPLWLVPKRAHQEPLGCLASFLRLARLAPAMHGYPNNTQKAKCDESSQRVVQGVRPCCFRGAWYSSKAFARVLRVYLVEVLPTSAVATSNMCQLSPWTLIRCPQVILHGHASRVSVIICLFIFFLYLSLSLSGGPGLVARRAGWRPPAGCCGRRRASSCWRPAGPRIPWTSCWRAACRRFGGGRLEDILFGPGWGRVKHPTPEIFPVKLVS